MNTKLFLKIISVWVACFLIGMLIGKFNSPRLEKKADYENYIELNSNVTFFSYAKNHLYYFDEAGNKKDIYITDFSKPTYAARFEAGRKAYIYCELTDKIDTVDNPNYTPKLFRKNLSKEEWGGMLGLVGLPAGYNLMDIKPVVNNGNPIITAVTIVGGILGIGLGYYVGNNLDFDPDSELAQNVINDKMFWKGIVNKQKFTFAIKNLKPLKINRNQLIISGNQ